MYSKFHLLHFHLYSLNCKHQEFIKTGEIDGNLLQACLLLAQTDVIFRAGRPPNNYGKVEEGDMNDLFELMKTINELSELVHYI